MCGLVGFWTPGGLVEDAENLVIRMADRLVHRGPDGAGAWVSRDSGIALGHRRLAILDLSDAGRQPMHSACGRFVVAFNGEIYNHLELRARLEKEGNAPAWRGHSDTETLLAACAAWGLESTLKATVGMFALALWDRSARDLTLARDRMGEKPLYYGWHGRTFLFGSELKALRTHPAFEARVSRVALSLLLKHNYIPGPYSVYEGIFKLPPGNFVRIQPDDAASTPLPFWSFSQVVERGVSDPFRGTEAEALEELDCLLKRAISRQMIADVPLGVLLSGGLDSTCIAALMQAQSSSPVRTFTVGFADRTYNEAEHARSVAKHLGTRHTEVELSPDDALDLIPRIPSMYDEPFGDSSQLPTHLVARVARREVTVALAGDGGDELFGGYNRYFLGPKVWRHISWIPGPIRHAIGAALVATPAGLGNRLGAPIEGLVGVAQLGDKLQKLGLRMRTVRSIDDLYLALVTEWSAADSIARSSEEPAYVLNDRARWPRVPDPVSRMMALDALTYLPDDILVKVDRAAMAASLETRAPYLDHSIVEFAWSLPLSFKIRGGRGKWILRRLLDRYVPRELVDRPKMGFGIPLDGWLRGPLREWGEDLLQPGRLRREGFLAPDDIYATWLKHINREGSYGYRLWSVLMFQAWLAENAIAS